MANLKNRMRRAEETQRAFVGGKNDRDFFFRYDPQIPGEQETRFRQENPDCKSRIYVYYFGRANLNPYEPGAK